MGYNDSGIPSAPQPTVSNLTPVLFQNPSGGGINLFRDASGNHFTDPGGQYAFGADRIASGLAAGYKFNDNFNPEGQARSIPTLGANGAPIQGAGTTVDATTALAQQAAARGATSNGLPLSTYGSGASLQNPTSSFLNPPTGSATRSLISNTPGPGLIKGYDTNNNYAPVYVPAGKYVQGVSLTPKPSDKITSDSMGKVNSIVLPNGSSGSTSGADSLVAGAGATLAEITKQLTPAQTPAEAQQQDLLNKMTSLVGQEGQKAADQLTAEQASNLPGLKNQFAAINTQILTLTAQDKALTDSYQKANTTLEGQPMTLSRLQGSEAQNYKMYLAQKNENASQIGLLQATAQGLQGQITTAQDTVNRSIDLKYSTITAQLQTYQAQLNALAPELNKEEKVAAAAQQFYLDEQKQQIADAKQNDLTVQNLKLEAIKAGLTDTSILNKFDAKGMTVAQAQSLAAPYISKAGVLDQQYKQSEINKNNKDLNPTGTYVPGANPAVDAWVKNVNSGKFKISDVPAALKSAVSQGVAQTGGNSVSDILSTTQQSLKELQDMVDQNKGFSGAVGFKGLIGSFTGPIAGSEAANFANKAAQVVNDIVLPNLNLLHGLGRVTEKEFQSLSSAVQGLGINLDHSSRYYGTSSLSESQFKTELKDITDRIAAKAGDTSNSNQNAGTTLMTGPDGKQYNVPNDKVDAFTKAGGHK